MKRQSYLLSKGKELRERTRSPQEEESKSLASSLKSKDKGGRLPCRPRREGKPSLARGQRYSRRRRQSFGAGMRRQNRKGQAVSLEEVKKKKGELRDVLGIKRRFLLCLQGRQKGVG